MRNDEHMGTSRVGWAHLDAHNDAVLEWVRNFVAGKADALVVEQLPAQCVAERVVLLLDGHECCIGSLLLDAKRQPGDTALSDAEDVKSDTSNSTCRER
jgi:hypothetical protein